MFVPPWCVLADYYFRLRTNRCVSVQVAVGHGTWFLKQCSSMHVFKGPNIVHIKGQIISEQIYGVLKFSKKATNYCQDFLPLKWVKPKKQRQFFIPNYK